MKPVCLSLVHQRLLHLTSGLITLLLSCITLYNDQRETKRTVLLLLLRFAERAFANRLAFCLCIYKEPICRKNLSEILYLRSVQIVRPFAVFRDAQM